MFRYIILKYIFSQIRLNITFIFTFINVHNVHIMLQLHVMIILKIAINSIN
jgi:hypothetical protein